MRRPLVLLFCLTQANLWPAENQTRDLYFAIYGGDESRAKDLIKNIADVNEFYLGKTPLMAASERGNVELIQLLIAKKANVNLPNRDGSTALTYAARFGQTEPVELLLKHGAEVNGAAGGVTPLMAASEHGNVEIMQLLLAKGANVNIRAQDGSTALLFAAKLGQTEPVELLLKHGADAKATAAGETALMLAAAKLNPVLVHELLSRGLDVNAKSNNGNTALMLPLSYSYSASYSSSYPANLPPDEAAKARERVLQARERAQQQDNETVHARLETIRELIKANAEVSVRSPNGFLPLLLGRTLLHLAVVAQPYDLDLVKIFLDAGVDINAKDAQGQTALMLAANEARLDIARLLIDRGADLAARDRQGMTALMLVDEYQQKHASRGPNDVRARNYEKIAEMLSSSGSSTASEDLKIMARKVAMEKFVSAISRRDRDAVQSTLKEGADPNFIFQGSNDERVPAIAVAAATGSLGIVDDLLAAGVSPNATSKDGSTVMIWAALAGHDRIVEHLLERGASVNAQNSDGESALFAAAKWGRTQTAEILLSKGANPNLKAKSGVTPLMWAAHEAFYDTVDLLLKHGADPDAKDDDGKTALAWSKEEGIIAELYRMGPVEFVIGEKSERNRSAVVQRLSVQRAVNH